MTTTIRSIRNLDITDRRVFMRLDLNVPTKNGKVTDDTRIQAALPTINYALARGCKLILCSHLGRPDGEVNEKYSLEPVAKRLAELLNHDILLSDYPVGLATQKLVKELNKGDILLLENVRFSPHEKTQEEGFCKELASYADIYINDAFGTAHRAEASTAGMVPYVKVDCGVGFVMEKEIEALQKLTSLKAKPFVTILGGAKVSDKISLIHSLLDKCDTILVGGAMAYTFLAALRYPVGRSLVEQDQLEVAKKILAKAENRKINFLLPTDHVVAKEISETATTRIAQEDFLDDEMGLDIGPETQATYKKHILSAGKVFWNGPMGVFEMKPFASGSLTVANAMADTKAYTVVGGGDSVAAMAMSGRNEDVDHISTGGGASLTFLEGEPFPAIEALLKKD